MREFGQKKTLMSTLNTTGVKFIRSDSRELGRLREYLESEIISDLSSVVCKDGSELVSRVLLTFLGHNVSKKLYSGLLLDCKKFEI